MSPQISLYYIIVIQFGGVNLELCLEGLSPRNPRVATGVLPYRCCGVPEYAYCVNKLRQNVGLQT